TVVKSRPRYAHTLTRPRAPNLPIRPANRARNSLRAYCPQRASRRWRHDPRGLKRNAFVAALGLRQGFKARLEHDPEKHALGLDPMGGYGFSEKIMLHQRSTAPRPCLVSLCHQRFANR